METLLTGIYSQAPLLEVIAALLLSAVLVSLLLPLTGSSVEGNRRAVLGLSEPQLLRNQMDTVTAVYQAIYPGDLGELANHIAQGAGSSTYELVDSSWVAFNTQGKKLLRITVNKVFYALLWEAIVANVSTLIFSNKLDNEDLMPKSTS